MKGIFRSKLILAFIGIIAYFVIMLFWIMPAFAEEPTAVAPASGVTNATEYQSYLQTNFNTIHTILGDINVRDHIRVIENHDQFKTYDLAVIIDYDVINQTINIGDVMGSTAYTEEQKAAFKQSFIDYQKRVADLTIATFPNKKIRGGFVVSGYKYKNLKRGYYESSFCGWKNYGYNSKVLNYYTDTSVTEFNWYDFGAVGSELDLL